MELDKKKYKAEEVQSLLDELKTEYNGKLAERNEEIFELNGKLKRMRAELESFKNRDSLISSSLQAAEEQAEKIRETERLQYELALARLNDFQLKWESYFEYLFEKYPYYKITEQTLNIAVRLKQVLGSGEAAIEKLGKLDDLIERETAAAQFNPKEKIERYIEYDVNGFNLEEVLNPGELQLEDLCRELGLMEDD